ncbi:HNH endonuclease family protein [Corynebacterium guaraldiae]|nr:HNH endonuclease family protein [Corynebacterium guaraldiae]
MAFANDPLNLVATARNLNQAKSDSLPADWLPPADRCDYSQRLAAVARKYQLPLPSRDYVVMRHQCRFDFISPRR